MRARFFLIVVAAVFMVGAVQGTALAAITKCKFDVWTTNETDANGIPRPLRLDFYLELEDSTLPPPEAFSKVLITLPGGLELNYSAVYWKYWAAGQRYFFLYKYATELPGGTIPAGTYKLTVTDKAATPRTVTVSDSLSSNTALPLVALTYPPATTPPTVVPLNATLTWSKVAGALYYRVLLMNETTKEFVYDRQHNPMWIYNATSLTLPKGALIATHTYTLRIEARDSDKNMSRRSRTLFVTFKAGEK